MGLPVPLARPLPQRQDGWQQPCQGSHKLVALPATLGAAVPMVGTCQPRPHAPSADQVGAKITGVPLGGAWYLWVQQEGSWSLAV